MKLESLKEICGNCGLTFGAHCATNYESKQYSRVIPRNYCPGHEGRMDWDAGPGTVFSPSGKYEKVDYGTAAQVQDRFKLKPGGPK